MEASESVIEKFLSKKRNYNFETTIWKHNNSYSWEIGGVGKNNDDLIYSGKIFKTKELAKKDSLRALNKYY